VIDCARQPLDTWVEGADPAEKYRLAGGVFTRRQLLELEIRHVVGPALQLRGKRPGRTSA
jgi:hypothetical protein